MAQYVSQLGAKFKKNTRGLDVIQSVYAFAMALGLSAVFIGSKTYLNDIIFGAAPIRDGRSVLIAMLFANVVLLGIRFFWVPSNLGALVYRATECAVKTKSNNLEISNASIAFHLLMIFAHGTMFFLICSEFEYVVFLSSSSLPLNAGLFTGYIIMHVCLLLVNAAWIGFIKMQEQRLERRARLNEDDTPSAGSVWWLNNLISASVAIAPFSILGACHSELTRCAVRSNNLAGAVIDLAPASAHQITVVFQAISALLPGIGGNFVNVSLIWALVVLLTNSLLDLLTTGKAYLFFEDVEWESGSSDQNASASATSTPGEII